MKKRGCFQITDVLYTMSFRDMLGWDKSKKMHPKYITFNLCHCYKAKNCPQLTKKESVPSHNDDPTFISSFRDIRFSKTLVKKVK